MVGFLKLGVAGLAGVILMTIAAGAVAAEPVQFNYQARLSDGNGAPLEGQHTLYLAVYAGGDANTLNSGANVYAETAVVTVTDGVVNHAVGSGTPTSGTLNAGTFAQSGTVYLQVAVDSGGNVVLPRTPIVYVPLAARALAAPATLFQQFGGTGVDGDRTVAAIEPVGAIRREYRNFTIPVGAALTVPQGWALIGVSGTCTIDGDISANGFGELGGSGGGSVGAGSVGGDATGVALQPRVPGCVSGAGGGGGGSVGGGPGGAGGGATASGGVGGVNGFGFSPGAGSVSTILSGGAVSGSGKTTTSNFASLITYRGAGGGGGGGSLANSGATGGAGGGVVYIECNELIFTGAITAKGAGAIGASGSAGGGGGGGGGVVLIRAKKITSNTGSVNVNGGTAGGSQSGPLGAGGGAGFWDIVQVN